MNRECLSLLSEANIGYPIKASSNGTVVSGRYTGSMVFAGHQKLPGESILVGKEEVIRREEA